MISPIADDLQRFGPDAPGTSETLGEAEARGYVRGVLRRHQENFAVATRLLPRHLRDDFAAVYAFCRWADDLGDDPALRGRHLDLLAWWRDELHACFAGEPRHPVFLALRPTVEKHDLPRRPFDDLIDAFVQDQSVTRYETWDQLLGYCRRSADPVGRLVLRMWSVRDDEADALADATCTALQLTNFWQDVRRDILERDRVYLPREIASAHGLDLDTLVELTRRDAAAQAGSGDGFREQLPHFRGAVREAVGRTWPLFERGRALWVRVPRRQRVDLRLFTLGGEAVLRRIERRDYDTWTARPRVGRWARAGLVLRAVSGVAAGG
ncbi:MAG: squalene synthase HpnC [Planctomycetota bacterium]